MREGRRIIHCLGPPRSSECPQTGQPCDPRKHCSQICLPPPSPPTPRQMCLGPKLFLDDLLCRRKQRKVSKWFLVVLYEPPEKSTQLISEKSLKIYRIPDLFQLERERKNTNEGKRHRSKQLRLKGKKDYNENLFLPINGKLRDG